MFLRNSFKLLCCLVVMAFHITLFAADSSNKKVFKSVCSKGMYGPQIEFDFSIEDKGDYYISFVMYGNSDEKYELMIDGYQKGFLSMNKNGLQNAFYQKTEHGLDPETVRLTKGSHTITVLGINNVIIPNVVEINVGESVDDIAASIDKPSDRILESDASGQLNSYRIATASLPDNYPYYDYYVSGKEYCAGNTYSTHLTLSKGMNVKLGVDPIYGYYPMIYLFKLGATGNNTWRSKFVTDASGNPQNTGTLDAYINEDGVYRCVLVSVRSEGATTFKWSLNNGQSYSYNFDCRVKYGLQRKITRNSYTGTSFFTTTNTGGSGDPVMYILDPSDRVVAFNDDAATNYNPSSYNSNLAEIFGLNSYCTWAGATSVPYVTVLLFDYSYYGSVTADIYGFVKKANGISGHTELDPNKLYMVSSGINTNYNCYAWSGGITKKLVNYEGNAFEGFDKYMANVNRYAGAIAYVRCWEVNTRGTGFYEYDSKHKVIGSYAADAVIDLWGTPSNREGGPYINHATVCKTANNQYHGFAWESKDFTGERYFHQRDMRKLLDNGYYQDSNGWGCIICSYRPATNAPASIAKLNTTSTSGEPAEQSNVVFSCTPKMKAMGINRPLSFEESVDLGLTVLRNAEFSEDENIKIEELLASVSQDVSNEYSSKLARWKKTWKHTSIDYMNNVMYPDKSNEHVVLKKFYEKNKEKVWPLLVKIVRDNNSEKMLILEDAVVNTPTGAAIIAEIDNELAVTQFDNDGAIIVTSHDDRCILICKKMLQSM